MADLANRAAKAAIEAAYSMVDARLSVIRAKRQQKNANPIRTYELSSFRSGSFVESFHEDICSEDGRVLFSGNSKNGILNTTVSVSDHASGKQWSAKGINRIKVVSTKDTDIQLSKSSGIILAEPQRWRIAEVGITSSKTLVMDEQGKLVAEFGEQVLIYEPCDESALLPLLLCLSLFNVARDHRGGGEGGGDGGGG